MDGKHWRTAFDIPPISALVGSVYVVPDFTRADGSNDSPAGGWVNSYCSYLRVFRGTDGGDQWRTPLGHLLALFLFFLPVVFDSGFKVSLIAEWYLGVS